MSEIQRETLIDDLQLGKGPFRCRRRGLDVLSPLYT
jgi:hypothetical protein